MVERDNDCWEGLRLVPGDKSAVYLGKLAGNFVMMTAVEVVLLALFGLFYDVPLPTGGGPPRDGARARDGRTRGGGHALRRDDRPGARARAALPRPAPSRAGALAPRHGEPHPEPFCSASRCAEVGHWLKLLAAADLVYLVIGLLTFEFILDA